MTSKIGRLRDALVQLLDEHEATGMLPTNQHFLWYELVARGVVDKTKARRNPGVRRGIDQDVNDALTDLRESGLIPWNRIEDETRRLDDQHIAGSIHEWLLDVLVQARIDPWQGDRPLVLTEARTMGVLRNVTRRYAVPLAPTNGQVAGFLHTEVAPSLVPGQRVLYLGDLDLSGDQIERNTHDVLVREVGPLRWERLALTTKQATKYRLTPIVKADRRYKPARRHEAIELEAVGQQVVVAILRNRLDSLLAEPIERWQRREARERTRLRKVLDS